MTAKADAAILALDQGTTATTAMVFGPHGEVLGRATSEFTQHYPQPGWVEHDPEEIWQTSRRVMADALRGSGIAPSALKAIGITNQRETAVVWERSSGRPVHRAIVWQSRQTAEICSRLKAGGHEPLFHERTGLVVDPYFSGTKVRWILDRDEGLQSRAEAGDLAFGTIDTWLLNRMTAGRVHATEPTNASRTLLYNIHERDWDPELLSILDVPAAMLPEVRPSSGVFGEISGVEGVPDGVPVAGIAGDQQAALFGQGCWEPGLA
jgi:glycerol kinase